LGSFDGSTLARECHSKSAPLPSAAAGSQTEQQQTLSSSSISSSSSSLDSSPREGSPTAAAAAGDAVEPRLFVLGNGSGSPCLDLSRVPAALADATVGVDLLVSGAFGVSCVARVIPAWNVSILCSSIEGVVGVGLFQLVKCIDSSTARLAVELLATLHVFEEYILVVGYVHLLGCLLHWQMLQWAWICWRVVLLGIPKVARIMLQWHASMFFNSNEDALGGCGVCVVLAHDSGTATLLLSCLLYSMCFMNRS
jgi:hypothetical protein